jgi:hypothetical protein
MTPEETSAVLATAALYDNRKVDSRTVIMWHRAIGDLLYQDCENAVVAHYTETTDWLMPAHVRTRVKAIRRTRLEHEIIPAPSAEPGPYQAELRTRIREIADDMQVPPLAIAAPVREDDPPQEFTEARELLGSALPRPGRVVRDPQELARQQAAESRAARHAADVAEPDAGKPAA